VKIPNAASISTRFPFDAAVANPFLTLPFGHRNTPGGTPLFAAATTRQRISIDEDSFRVQAAIPSVRAQERAKKKFKKKPEYV